MFWIINCLIFGRLQAQVTKAIKRLNEAAHARHSNPKDVELDSLASHAVVPYSADEPTGSQNILQFSSVLPKKADSRNSVTSADTRGAAALQFFLFVYISPVEICLKMLTCYKLPGLYSPSPPPIHNGALYFTLGSLTQ
jgi:hypothetical protein